MKTLLITFLILTSKAQAVWYIDDAQISQSPLIEPRFLELTLLLLLAGLISAGFYRQLLVARKPDFLVKALGFALLAIAALLALRFF